MYDEMSCVKLLEEARKTLWDGKHGFPHNEFVCNEVWKAFQSSDEAEIYDYTEIERRISEYICHSGTMECHLRSKGKVAEFSAETYRNIVQPARYEMIDKLIAEFKGEINEAV